MNLTDEGLFWDCLTRSRRSRTRMRRSAPQVGAKALQFIVQGETKRTMASGDATEFEMTLKTARRRPAARHRGQGRHDLRSDRGGLARVVREALRPDRGRLGEHAVRGPGRRAHVRGDARARRRPSRSRSHRPRARGSATRSPCSSTRSLKDDPSVDGHRRRCVRPRGSRCWRSRPR